VTFGGSYHALSQVPRGFLTGGLVYAVASPLRIVQITPGNLGVDEWVAAMVGKALAFDVTTGLIVAAVFQGPDSPGARAGRAARVGLAGTPEQVLTAATGCDDGRRLTRGQGLSLQRIGLRQILEGVGQRRCAASTPSRDGSSRCRRRANSARSTLIP